MSTLNGGPGNIVTNGLVMYLDAANYASYTSGSLTWYDLTKNNNSGSLINGPTFDSGNGGSIVFDGVNDYVALQNVTFTDKISIGIWYKSPNPVSNYPLLYGNGTTISNESFYSTILGPVYGTSNKGKVAAFFKTDTISQSSGRIDLVSTSVITGSYCYLMATYESSSLAKLYINASLEASSSTSASNLNPNTGSFNLGGGNPVPVGSDRFTGSIAVFHIYNRALSSTEVLQNYNAQKTRFGLT